jgi:hypothetical protein
MSNLHRARSADVWAPILTRYLGMTGVIFCALVWVAANRLEPVLLASFGGLIGISQGADALRLMREPPPIPPPLPDTTVGYAHDTGAQ